MHTVDDDVNNNAHTPRLSQYQIDDDTLLAELATLMLQREPELIDSVTPDPNFADFSVQGTTTRYNGYNVFQVRKRDVSATTSSHNSRSPLRTRQH
jgi:hypothetical protein